ncbi:hypothetical protein EJB05_15624, partial [Eragrostis curvula]
MGTTGGHIHIGLHCVYDPDYIETNRDEMSQQGNKRIDRCVDSGDQAVRPRPGSSLLYLAVRTRLELDLAQSHMQ